MILEEIGIIDFFENVFKSICRTAARCCRSVQIRSRRTPTSHRHDVYRFFSQTTRPRGGRGERRGSPTRGHSAQAFVSRTTRRLQAQPAILSALSIARAKCHFRSASAPTPPRRPPLPSPRTIGALSVSKLGIGARAIRSFRK
ncbi:hypothetical protein EVAR_96726_1 [Eumeta japonica]|uniref:Uncharacterized protein n=1 Tax=Eumeta variegata TaxID=151549 RepID=A0A4C1WJH6_EUMVA|nr:hypothetical protein EVAR_96726_1 [Eumeta japonica]